MPWASGWKFVSALASLLTLGTGCPDRPTEKQEQSTQSMKTIDDVIKIHSERLLAIPGVVGVYHGLTDDSVSCLKVMVKKKTHDLEKVIPKTLEGFTVIIEETGEIRPMN
jgi:hypothetical protein